MYIRKKSFIGNCGLPYLQGKEPNHQVFDPKNHHKLQFDNWELHESYLICHYWEIRVWKPRQIKIILFFLQFGTISIPTQETKTFHFSCHSPSDLEMFTFWPWGKKSREWLGRKKSLKLNKHVESNITLGDFVPPQKKCTEQNQGVSDDIFR